jgi:hypothetical protein
MHFAFPGLSFIQNIFQIDPFLIEKCKTRNSKYEVSVDKNFPNDVLIWAAKMPLDIERLTEDLHKLFSNSNTKTSTSYFCKGRNNNFNL